MPCAFAVNVHNHKVKRDKNGRRFVIEIMNIGLRRRWRGKVYSLQDLKWKMAPKGGHPLDENVNEKGLKRKKRGNIFL